MPAEQDKLAFPTSKKRTKIIDASYLLLMWLPNVLNPRKSIANLRHPVHEVTHTTHKQYPIDGDSLHAVEHLLFNRLVTIDVIERDVFQKGLISRTKQLFRADFYYGHGQYFPQPFRLVDRTFVKKGIIFDREEHLRRFKK